jgi:hypothetical protein
VICGIKEQVSYWGGNMIELKNNSLIFTFPEITLPGAKLTISFKRTLRVPDDGTRYPLPSGLGKFPLEDVDDYRQAVPKSWIEHGGVMLPLYQSEALWIDFTSSYIDDHEAAYPFAVKVAAGKINAVTGGSWSDSLSRDPQDYLVVPGQPWLDGYSIGTECIRQFVAMPLGDGYSTEGQITGGEGVGGVQIVVYPMKREAFEKRWPRKPLGIKEPPHRYGGSEPANRLSAHQDGESGPVIRISLDQDGGPKAETRLSEYQDDGSEPVTMLSIAKPDMGMAAGGRIGQEIYEDPFDLSEWDMNSSSRCFVNLANSEVWRAITWNHPPAKAPTAKVYSSHGLPWFEYYSDRKPLAGSNILKKLKSVVHLGIEKGRGSLPENDPVDPGEVVHIEEKQSPDQVREWSGRAE